MVKVCECCGRPIPEIDVMSELTRTQGKILLALDKAGRVGVPLRTLVDRIYGDDPNGGPINAISCMRTMRSRMEPVLNKFGMRISSDRGGAWRLDKHG